MLASVDHQESNTRLVRLEAHAVVRLAELSDEGYDCYDLPIERSRSAERKDHSFGKKVKTLASYLTARINPAFQECQVIVVESMQGLAFEVHSVVPARGQGGGSVDRPVYTAPLATLLDVSTDSVVEKDNVVFTRLPHSFAPGDEDSSVVRPVVQEKAAPHKRGEIMTTLFSAYGDIGLRLTFRAPRRGGPRGKPLTRVDLRFVCTAERNTWMSFCGEAYVGLLVDSIRNRERRICPPAVVAAAAKVVGARHHRRSPPGASLGAAPPTPPSRDAVERYIDFFLSAPQRKTGGGENAGGDNDGEGDGDGAADDCSGGGTPSEPPCGGLLRVCENGGGHRARLCRLCHVRDPARDGGGGVDYLLVEDAKPTLWRGKRASLKRRIPLEGFTVYAEDDLQGSSFFLELHAPPLQRGGDAGDDHDHARVSCSCPPAASSPSSSFAMGSMSLHSRNTALSAAGGEAVVSPLGSTTLQLLSESYASRRQWLRWFERTLGKPILFLSQARREAEMERGLAVKSKTRFLGRDTNW